MCGLGATGKAALVALRIHRSERTPDSRRQVLCIAENAIGPLAFRNDDILRCYSGKWVNPTRDAAA